MNSNDLKDLIEMLKRKIDKGSSIEDIKTLVYSNQSEEIYLQIKEELEEYIAYKTELLEKNKPYWMLICNPKLWGDGTEEYEVNELLFNLNEEEPEYWKINDKTSMELQMKKGHRGIIKVSEDSRSKALRTDENNNIVPLLEAGIYGIFEVIEDEDGDCTYQDDYGDSFVNIKVINNFYKEGMNISKEISRELIGETVYNSIPSRKINKEAFENVVNHIESLGN